MRFGLPVMLALLATGCLGPVEDRPVWDGEVRRGWGADPIPWQGFVFYNLPSWSGYLEDRTYGAGGWMHTPDDGPVFAHGYLEIDSTAGMTSTPPEPLEVGDTIDILGFGEDRDGAEWWAYASWIEEDVDGEALFRSVYNNGGGDIDGTVTFTGTDGETWWTADVTYTITQDNGDYPGEREVSYALRWGPFEE